MEGPQSPGDLWAKSSPNEGLCRRTMPSGPLVSLAGLLVWPGFCGSAPGLRHQAPKAVPTRRNSGSLGAHLGADLDLCEAP